ncbi:MAG: PPC domain-containing DNA-binding protein [Bacteroidota bacterium]
MQYTYAKQGRTFVIRLEDGDVIHECIERFVAEKNIASAYFYGIGGVDKGSNLICGPEQGRSQQIKPMEVLLSEVHEATGNGTVFPDSEGNARVHMHLSCGRGSNSLTGCIRKGVYVWHVFEIVLVELTDNDARRMPDEATGFELLSV